MSEFIRSNSLNSGINNDLILIEQIDEKAVEQEKRGNTQLATKNDDIKYDLFFGCAPSIGVKSDTKFMADICEALLDRYADDMTLTFPEFLEGIKGTDTNFELVSS